jgi:hypothetical protein
MRNIFLSGLVIFSLALGGCGKKADTTTGGGATPTPTPASTNIPFSLKLETAWEGTTTKTVEQTCEIPAGSASGTTLNCTVSVPEARLHFSKTYFTLATNSTSTCEVLLFQPYYYLAGTAAAFLPEWVDSAVDCTASPTPVDCYSGVAVDIVTDFPTFTGMYHLSASSLSNVYEAESANLSGRSSSNRWTSNNLTIRNANIVIAGDGYSANSMVDYVGICADRWYQPIYTINLTVSDDDESTGNPAPNSAASNHFPDWNSALGFKSTTISKPTNERAKPIPMTRFRLAEPKKK